ncbi:four-carbon acid sugar kinase family protein [Sphingobium sp. CR2-8]|uniref:four-carbon acid sugar kinase family protein n=1 Tax=Sphingobium sp. CR2-8 TaxID=1306534 RepID=UPI002DBD0D5B|nr:four-carbon acid sugar kinase family protein [Sphingobium sp. CR2-8]MEC3909243.1 four-carbon acid sugar kinase family protein [Sphingobium sp. CR2-8]
MTDLLYAFYGDDFTGSTDVLEQLAEGGVPAILFLRQPDEALRARFPDVRAIGLAGDARSQSPAWMDAHLPGAFAALGAGGAPIMHYKTCSTFDSSPTVGSIGRALEIGRAALGGIVPILIGAPHLGRYLIFGTLFAAAGGVVHRIDRHPTMARHPVTPMTEADMRLHLARQTKARIALAPIDRIAAGDAEALFLRAVDEGDDAILFDGMDEASLQAVGQVLLAHQGARFRFAVGSSGVTRAMIWAWQAQGIVPPPAALPRAGAVDRLLVMSGSCSPVTAAQIGVARGDGFATIAADVGALVGGSPGEEDRLTQAAVAALRDNGRVVVHSAEGPLSDEVPAAGAAIGAALGRVSRDVVRQTGIGRILFAGGDTSSHGVAQMGLDALAWAAPLERGAPLVRAYCAEPELDGLELVLKGGQMGAPDFFETVRRGG